MSKKYVLIGEYFNRTPTMIPYQGKENLLFKRDFGKYFLKNFDLEVIDYGFLWGHYYDVAGFDDFTWWLFKKMNPNYRSSSIFPVYVNNDIKTNIIFLNYWKKRIIYLM